MPDVEQLRRQQAICRPAVEACRPVQETKPRHAERHRQGGLCDGAGFGNQQRRGGQQDQRPRRPATRLPRVAGALAKEGERSGGEQDGLRGEGPEQSPPNSGMGEETADQRPAERGDAPDHCHDRHQPRPQPLGKQQLDRDIAYRDHGTAAETLDEASDEHDRHVGGQGIGDAA